MKSWADHSDSEDEGYVAPPPVNEKEEVDEKGFHSEEEEFIDNGTTPAAPPPKPKEYVLPQEPPFTAFIGNLAPVVEEQDVAEVVGEHARVESVRIMQDRETGRKKGFGYIELLTVDDLAALLEMNGRLEIGGRVVRLDVAEGRRSGGRGDNRGRGQRGGGHRGQRRDGNNYDRREYRSSDDVDGSKFRGGLRRNDNADAGGAPAERPRLVLSQRTKPVEEGAGTKSSIFGTGKARDANAPPSSLQQSLQKSHGAGDDGAEHGSKHGKQHGDRRHHGGEKSGRGGGRGGRTKGRGGRGKGSRSDDRYEGTAKRAPKPVAPVVKVEEPKKEPKVINKFAMLGFDSDSD
eukprot:CAMPEP_0196813490 /NCGR_PEP_ID=MMETSP1362-20130617/37082_1 /TAXON_ID=163516 /ORGANISM="Leptocylindrus danicus, Strain CCMP1856" /LENGTH=346 /DNA_ID=CAMNT_0042189757 /DNA_START=60 /DNA_END=1100 /DNA_ORIENTATION=-